MSLMDMIIASSCCPSIPDRFQMITVLGPSLSLSLSSLILCFSPLYLNMPSFLLVFPAFLFLFILLHNFVSVLFSLQTLCTLFDSFLPITPPSSHNHFYPPHVLYRVPTIHITNLRPFLPLNIASSIFSFFLLCFYTASHPWSSSQCASLQLTIVFTFPKKKYPPMGGMCLPRNTLAVMAKCYDKWQETNSGDPAGHSASSSRSGVRSATTRRAQSETNLQRYTISALILLKLRSLHTQHGPETGNTGSDAAGTPTVCVRLHVCRCNDVVSLSLQHEATVKGCVIRPDTVRRSRRFIVRIIRSHKKQNHREC